MLSTDPLYKKGHQLFEIFRVHPPVQSKLFKYWTYSIIPILYWNHIWGWTTFLTIFLMNYVLNDFTFTIVIIGVQIKFMITGPTSNQNIKLRLLVILKWTITYYLWLLSNLKSITADYDYWLRIPNPTLF